MTRCDAKNTFVVFTLVRPLKRKFKKRIRCGWEWDATAVFVVRLWLASSRQTWRPPEDMINSSDYQLQA